MPENDSCWDYQSLYRLYFSFFCYFCLFVVIDVSFHNAHLGQAWRFSSWKSYLSIKLQFLWLLICSILFVTSKKSQKYYCLAAKSILWRKKTFFGVQRGSCGLLLKEILSKMPWQKLGLLVLWIVSAQLFFTSLLGNWFVMSF